MLSDSSDSSITTHNLAMHIRMHDLSLVDTHTHTHINPSTAAHQSQIYKMIQAKQEGTEVS